MDSPKCINKVDIVIDSENVTFSKCCLTCSNNFIRVPFKEIYSMTEDQIFKFIWDLPSKKSDKDIIERRQDFNCEGSCITDWKNHPNILGISTKACNLKCAMCRDEVYTSKTIQQEKELYFRILNLACQRPEIDTVVPAVFGEFFMFKKEAFQFLSEAKKHNTLVYSATNLTILNDDDISELLSGKYDNFALIASIDSFTPSIYTQMRRGASCKDAFQVYKNFSRIVENKSKLKDFRVNTVIFPGVNFIKEDIENTLFVFESHKFDNYFLFKAVQTPLEEYTKEAWFTEDFQKRAHFSYSY